MIKLIPYVHRERPTLAHELYALKGFYNPASEAKTKPGIARPDLVKQRNRSTRK